MKKVLFLVIFFIFGVCLFSEAFAQLRKDISVMEAPLVSMNVEKNEVTVKNSLGDDMTFLVKRGVDPSWKIGSQLVLWFKSGTNEATLCKPAK